jgi:hypothetical protein
LVNSVIAAFPAPYRFSGVSHVFPVHPDSERVDAERGYVGPVVDIYIIPFVCEPGRVASQGIYCAPTFAHVVPPSVLM